MTKLFYVAASGYLEVCQARSSRGQPSSLELPLQIVASFALTHLVARMATDGEKKISTRSARRKTSGCASVHVTCSFCKHLSTENAHQSCRLGLPQGRTSAKRVQKSEEAAKRVRRKRNFGYFNVVLLVITTYVTTWPHHFEF